MCCCTHTMNVGDTCYLSYDIYPADATDQSITWCSSNPDVVRIDVATGKMTAVCAGTALITATTNDGSFVVDCVVYVSVPEMFRHFVEDGIMDRSSIKGTNDGFCLITTSLATLLMENGVESLAKDSQGDDVRTVQTFYDDWYVFAVTGGAEVKYGLYKMREQEDEHENDDEYYTADADGDNPGVAISFVALSKSLLETCLTTPTKENQYELLQNLNRVTNPEDFVQDVFYEEIHDDTITAYFADVSSKAAYLIAEEYVKFIAKQSENGVLAIPTRFHEMLNKIDAINTQLADETLNADSRQKLEAQKEKLMRIPNWLVQNNKNAGYCVYLCPGRKILIDDVENLTIYEKYAILPVFTANVNFNSFAAEVEFHADAVLSLISGIPVAGNIWYGRAIRADMGIGEENESGGFDSYYDLNSDIVRNQAAYHGQY